MDTPMRCLRVYKDLAGWYEDRGQAPMRDRFLVLAAFAAHDLGREDEAEGLRQRLLRGNPHHMLKPYSSVRQALMAEDVQAYLQALQTNYPCETAEEMLRGLRAGEEAAGARRKGEGGAMPTMRAPPMPALSVPLPSPEEQDVTATLPLGQSAPKLLGTPPARREPEPPETAEQDVTATLPLGQSPPRPRPAPVLRKEPQRPEVAPLRPTELPGGHGAPPPAAEEVRPVAPPVLPDADDALPERSRRGDLTPTVFPEGLPPTMPPGSAPPLPPGMAPRPVRRGAQGAGAAVPRGATPPPTAAIPILRRSAPPPPAPPEPAPSPFLPLRPEPVRPAEEPAAEGDHTAGSWLGAGLCGIVLTAAMLLVGYTLARPFLPPEWLP